MKIRRFYTGDKLELDANVWVNDEALLHRWLEGNKYSLGDELILFNDLREERLYRIDKLSDRAVHLVLVTELEPKLPKKELYLCFPVISKEISAQTLQKCTELGVKHFVPILSDRGSEFDLQSAKDIVISATENGGRTDIPKVREPITLESSLKELSNGSCRILVAEHGDDNTDINGSNQLNCAIVLYVSQNGGWSNEERGVFSQYKPEFFGLGDLKLNPDTAAIESVSLIMSK